MKFPHLFTPQEIGFFEAPRVEGQDPRVSYMFQGNLLPNNHVGLGFVLEDLGDHERLQRIEPLSRVLSMRATRALYTGTMGGVLDPSIKSFDVSAHSLNITHNGSREAGIIHRDIAERMARATGGLSLREIIFRRETSL